MKHFVQVFLKNHERISYKGKILEVKFYSRAWNYIVIFLKEVLADYVLGDFDTIQNHSMV